MGWLKRLVGGGSKAAEAPSASPVVSPEARAAKHEELTKIRLAEYTELFGCEPSRVFSNAELTGSATSDFLIDVFVFTLETGQGDVDVAVTNGMSDQRMLEKGDSSHAGRRELIQYLRQCTPAHAGRLRDMAWLPLHDQFVLNFKDTIDWPHAAVEGTPWSNAFFLYPLVRSHDEFRMTVDGDEVNLLWHVPISPEERKFKVAQGPNALLDRLDEVELPWIFDESNRPPLV
jgi:hypothetical protein